MMPRRARWKMKTRVTFFFSFSGDVPIILILFLLSKFNLFFYVGDVHN